MSAQLEELLENPQSVFSGSVRSEELLKEVKSILDPITSENSVLDELHVEGLVSSQVWGQVKLIIDGVNESLLFEKIPQIKEIVGDQIHHDESDSEEDDEDEANNSSEQEYEDAPSKTDVTQESDSDSEYYNAVEDAEEADYEEAPEEDKFGLNDKFFSIDKFNKITDEADKANDEYNNDDQEVDLFAEKLEGESDNEDLMYTDFFKAQKGDEKEEEENNNDEENQDEEAELSDPDLEIAPQKDAFGLNDDFFSIDDFNKQIVYMEDHDDFIEEQSEDDEDIDLFADMEEDDDEEMLQYNDFFKQQVSAEEAKKLSKKKSKGVKFDKSKDEVREFNEEDYDAAYDMAMRDVDDEEYYDDDEQQESNDEQEGDNEEQVDESKLSTFEKQQRQIQREISALEKESIAEKKWTMKGEASAKSRDSDALLEEDLQFDRTAKPVPVITQDFTESIDDIIRRRIINDQFDDVPKRIISELNNFKASKKVEVSEQKSQQSLAELYEDEYNNRDRQAEAQSEELTKAHNEITELFISLNHKLDSLCSAHFIPKPKQQSLDIKVQTSTIAMEEAQPLTMNQGDSLAPQEVYKTQQKIGKNEVMLRSGVVMSKDELDRAEKQRLRRAKKRKIHNQLKESAQKKKNIPKASL